MTDRQAPRAALLVFIGWWLLLTFAAAWGSLGSGVFAGVLYRLKWQFGLFLVVGVSLTLFGIWFSRAVRYAMLSGKSVRGLNGTIGELPLVSVPNLSGDRKEIQIQSNKEIRLQAYHDWLTRYAIIFPAHKAVLEDLIRVFINHKHLPATHIEGGHGGRNLLEHSVLVAGVMVEQAASFQYTGLFNLNGKLVLPLRKADYQFQWDDPLVYLVGLAHDIGKIDSYIFSSDKKVIDCKNQHDQIGARMLARIPSVWDLPEDDRQILLHVVGHYHHPQMMPLDMDGRALDDRMMAFQELLIAADNAASVMESVVLQEEVSSQTDGLLDMSRVGSESNLVEKATESIAAATAEPSDTATNKSADISQKDVGKASGTPSEPTPVARAVECDIPAKLSSPAVSGDFMFDVFVDLVSEAGRINGSKNEGSVGQKFGEYIVFHESSLLAVLSKKLGKDAVRVPGGRFDLIERLMESMSAKGVLLKHFEGHDYPPNKAYFDVEFFSLGKANKSGDKLAMWRHAVIIRPGKVLPGLALMPDYDAKMVIVGQSCDAPPVARKRQGIDLSPGGSKSTSLEEARAALKAELLRQSIRREQKKNEKQAQPHRAKGANRQPAWSILEELKEQAAEFGRPATYRNGRSWLCKEMLLKVFPQDMHKMVEELWQHPPADCEIKKAGEFTLLGYPDQSPEQETESDKEIEVEDKPKAESTPPQEMGSQAEEVSTDEVVALDEFMPDAAEEVSEDPEDPVGQIVDDVLDMVRKGAKHTLRGDLIWVKGEILLAGDDEEKRHARHEILLQLVSGQEPRLTVKQVGDTLLVGVKRTEEVNIS